MTATRTTDPRAVYHWVDTASGNLAWRNRPKRVSEVDGYGKTERYASWQRCTDALPKWVATHRNEAGKPTVAGFDGPTWAAHLVLDFDAEDDPGRALDPVRKLLHKLDSWGVDLRVARVYFSGAKGFHVELPGALFGGFAPSTELHAYLRAAALRLMDGWKIDTSIYDKTRLMRLENSRHGKSGLCRVRLTPDEALNIDIDAIRAIAAAPRGIGAIPELTPIPDDDIAPNDILVELWTDAQADVQQGASRKRTPGAVTDDARDRQTVAAIAAAWPSALVADAGNNVSRHADLLMPAAGFLTRRTSAEHTVELLCAAAEQAGDASFLNGRDWRGEIERLAEGSAARRGTGGRTAGQPTLSEHFPSLAAVLGALWPAPTAEPTVELVVPREDAVPPFPTEARPTGGAPGQTGTVLAGGWPAPAPIFGAPEPPELPLELLPREIADITTDVAERLQCPADYVAWTLLVAEAGLIGRGAGIRPKGRDDWTERACLWAALIGPPSWMKSPAIREGLRPLHRQQEQDAEVFGRLHAEWDTACAELKANARRGEQPRLPVEPTMARRWTSDATIEKLADLMAESPGLTLHRDELSGWIAGMNKYARAEGDRQFFLEAYSGGAYAVDRIKRGTTWVRDLYLGIVGGVQPDIARGIFGTGPDDGFHARFCSIWPALPGDWRPIDRWPNRAARAALDAVSDRLALADWSSVLQQDDFRPVPFCRLDPEAQGIFFEWHAALMRELRSGTYQGRHAARVGKYGGVAARLTLVSHLVEWAAGRQTDAQVVPAQTVARVLDLMDDYLRPMETRVYTAYGVTADAEAGRRIARWILDTHPERFTARDILRHDWSGLQTAEAVGAGLDWLVTRRWLKEAEPEARPGRPSNVYLVNPRLREAGRG
ncbi:MAG: DUF3987 domain-containing protein [Chloroflexi bacterium]|nr:DUF3987 domain-containing protein [Chloroflexota bacterium]